MSLGQCLLTAVFCLLLISAGVLAQNQMADNMTPEMLAEFKTQQERLARDPKDAEAAFKISVLLEEVQQWQKAAAGYEYTLQLKPDFAFAQYRRGWCLAGLNKFDEALAAHQQALKVVQTVYFKRALRPAQAHYAVGWDLFNQQRYSEAVEHFTWAINAEPNFQEARYEIARVLLAQSKVQEALAVAAKLDSVLANLLRREVELTAEASHAVPNDESVFRMEKNRRPNITQREKAKYTVSARDEQIQGVVLLDVIFFSNGKLGGLRVKRGLPYGLSAQALIAAEKLRFKPAMEDGKPISVRAVLEFTFALY